MDKFINGNEFRCDFDIIVDNFIEIELNQITALPMIIVYDKPIDYPGKYVARLMGIYGVKPEMYRHIMLKDTLAEIHAGIPLIMCRLSPSLNDDPKIIEVFI